MAKSKFSDELFDKICEIIATSNRGLVSICKEVEISPVTFYSWIDSDKKLMNKYARAKELQSEFLVEEIIALSDNERPVTEEISNSEGTYTVTKDNYNRTRLQVDSRKWLASKLYPKKFGEKLSSDKDSETDSTNYDDFVKKINDI